MTGIRSAYATTLRTPRGQGAVDAGEDDVVVEGCGKPRRCRDAQDVYRHPRVVGSCGLSSYTRGDFGLTPPEASIFARGADHTVEVEVFDDTDVHQANVFDPRGGEACSHVESNAADSDDEDLEACDAGYRPAGAGTMLSSPLPACRLVRASPGFEASPKTPQKRMRAIMLASPVALGQVAGPGGAAARYGIRMTLPRTRKCSPSAPTTRSKRRAAPRAKVTSTPAGVSVAR